MDVYGHCTCFCFGPQKRSVSFCVHTPWHYTRFIKVVLPKTMCHPVALLHTPQKLWSLCGRNKAPECVTVREIEKGPFIRGVISAVCELPHSVWCLHPYMVRLPSTCYRHTHVGQSSVSLCLMNERINKAFIHDTGMWLSLWIKEKFWKLKAIQVGHCCSSVRTTCVWKRRGLWKPKWEYFCSYSQQYTTTWNDV